jgi:hypothetical protein
MPDPQAIRRTSDVMLAQLSELEELERTKRELQPGSRAQLRLTRRVETLARKVLHTAGQQSDLVATIAEMTADGTEGAPTASREPHLVLSEWREAERTMEREVPGTRPWESARTDVERLRAEYRRAFDARGVRD